MTERILAEAAERERHAGVFENLSAWPLLTERQQRIIKSSLYLEQRTKRPRNVKGENEYKKSKTLRDNWFCHASVAVLEQSVQPDSPHSLDQSFFEGTYRRYESFSELEKAIEAIGYPCVVLLSLNEEFEMPEDNEMDDQVHSCLALGRDGEQEVLVWEKEGYYYPYRIVSLQTAFKEYPLDMYYIAVRPLKPYTGDENNFPAF